MAEKECPECKGRGEIPLFRFYTECEECEGEGVVEVCEVDDEGPDSLDSPDTLELPSVAPIWGPMLGTHNKD